MNTLRRTKIKGWYEYYRETCPICNSSGGCMIHEKGDKVVCIRVESETVFSKELQSWLHRLTKKEKINMDGRAEWNSVQKKQPSSILDLVYGALLQTTTLNASHYTHLTSSSRGMIQSEIETRGYRSFPIKPWETVKEITKRIGYQKFPGIPGFFKNEYGWSISGFEGLLIPYRNQNNEIVGFQIRVESPKNDVEINKGTIDYLRARVLKQPGTVQAFVNGEMVWQKEMEIGQTEVVHSENESGTVKLVKGQRYFWLSSANREGGTGAGDPSPVHVAVPSEQLKHWKNSTRLTANAVWYTEGALKADIAAEHIGKVFSQEELLDIGSTVIATPGVNTWRTIMPVLKDMQVKHVNIAIDMDVMTNEYVEFYLKELAMELKKEGYTANLVIWNNDDGKGIDDVLINRRIPQLRKLF